MCWEVRRQQGLGSDESFISQGLGRLNSSGLSYLQENPTNFTAGHSQAGQSTHSSGSWVGQRQLSKEFLGEPRTGETL